MGLLGSIISGQNPEGGLASALLGLLASEGGHTDTSNAAGPTEPSSQSPAAVSGGLSELVQRFERNGLGDVIQSWIGSSSNQPVAPDELRQAVGPDTIDRLSQQTGLGHGQLLPLLAQALPMIVDRLTPNQRVPQPAEVARMQSNGATDI